MSSVELFDLHAYVEDRERELPVTGYDREFFVRLVVIATDRAPVPPSSPSVVGSSR